MTISIKRSDKINNLIEISKVTDSTLTDNIKGSIDKFYDLINFTFLRFPYVGTSPIQLKINPDGSYEFNSKEGSVLSTPMKGADTLFDNELKLLIRIGVNVSTIERVIKECLTTKLTPNMQYFGLQQIVDTYSNMLIHDYTDNNKLFFMIDKGTQEAYCKYLLTGEWKGGSDRGVLDKLDECGISNSFIKYLVISDFLAKGNKLKVKGDYGLNKDSLLSEGSEFIKDTKEVLKTVKDKVIQFISPKVEGAEEDELRADEVAFSMSKHEISKLYDALTELTINTNTRLREDEKLVVNAFKEFLYKNK